LKIRSDQVAPTALASGRGSTTRRATSKNKSCGTEGGKKATSQAHHEFNKDAADTAKQADNPGASNRRRCDGREPMNLSATSVQVIGNATTETLFRIDQATFRSESANADM
jgi:hypothetical protein